MTTPRQMDTFHIACGRFAAAPGDKAANVGRVLACAGPGGQSDKPVSRRGHHPHPTQRPPAGIIPPAACSLPLAAGHQVTGG